jgi:hypothetical protein
MNAMRINRREFIASSAAVPLLAAPAEKRPPNDSCFTATLSDGGVQPLRLPARSPNLNAFAERWVRSVKQECLSKLILFSPDISQRI